MQDDFSFGTRIVALTEAHLNDKAGKSAGNIDIVLAVLGSDGKVLDFGASKFKPFIFPEMCEKCLMLI